MQTGHKTLLHIQARMWVQGVDDERGLGNGVIVTLKDGWVFIVDPVSRVRRFNTMTEAKQGTSLTAVQQKPYTRPDGIVPGDEVVLVRGGRGRGPETGPGFEREVRARYLGGSRHEVHCELLEADPHATVKPDRAGETGIWHGESFIRPIQR